MSGIGLGGKKEHFFSLDHIPKMLRFRVMASFFPYYSAFRDPYRKLSSLRFARNYLNLTQWIQIGLYCYTYNNILLPLPKKECDISSGVTEVKEFSISQRILQIKIL